VTALPRRLSGSPQAAEHWCRRWRESLAGTDLLLLLAATETAAVAGISAAGSTPEARRCTAAAASQSADRRDGRRENLTAGQRATQQRGTLGQRRTGRVHALIDLFTERRALGLLGHRDVHRDAVRHAVRVDSVDSAHVFLQRKLRENFQVPFPRPLSEAPCESVIER
jgi:hypothetical protein